MKRVLVIVALLAISAIYFFQSNDHEKVKIGSSASPEKLIQRDYQDPPKKIILLIGDGMGLNHILLGRIAFGGPEFNMAMDRMPVFGIVTTHSVDDLYTDSAASATAWNTGFKKKNRFVGVTVDKEPKKNISETIKDFGFISGLVATSSVTHATPAAQYAHTDSRYKEELIAQQLVESEIRIALGGGTEFFEQENKQDLFFIEDLSELKNISTDSRVIGLFAEDGIERSEGPSQIVMTKAALKFLSSAAKDCNNFFLMSEGSQIDWESHDNKVDEMLVELKDFNETINYVLDYAATREDTLVIVSSDHETGGLDVIKQSGDDVVIGWTSGSHTLAPIGIFAYGPGAENFSGKIDQTEIYKIITELASEASCSADQ